MTHLISHHPVGENVKDDGAPAEINMAKIPVSGDIAGLVFAAGTVLIFFWGIPEIRFLLPAAIVLGCAIAVGLHFIRHEDESVHIFPDVEGSAEAGKRTGEITKNRSVTKWHGGQKLLLAGAGVLSLAVCTSRLPAQSIPPQAPAFDVASIKINNSPGRPRPTIQYSSDTLTMRQVSLSLALRCAYGPESRIISSPDWMQTAPLYDIIAKASNPVPENQMRLMLRTLLADRFHMAIHFEKKEMPVMALLVAKGGAKFHESDGKYDPERGAEAPISFLGYDNDVHTQRRVEPGGRIRDSYSNTTMALFSGLLAAMGALTPYDSAPVPVVDMTGMPGRFDLAVIRDPPQGHEGSGPQTAEEVLADIKPLLEKQLGLTLERQKAMVDVLVVDRVDKTPTDN